MAFLQEAELWVGVGVALFFGLLIYLKVPGAAGRALDARGVKIQSALDEAQRLRDEASALLAEIKARHAAAEAQAVDLVHEAELEAQRMASEARVKLEDQIRRRTELADRRIAIAEAQAAQDVKSAAVDLAAKLAEDVLAAHLNKQKSDPLVDRAIDALKTRLH
jgi:F-type H+-transporting ATPase subunit b